jgi:hypothetical protein
MGYGAPELLFQFKSLEPGSREFREIEVSGVPL